MYFIMYMITAAALQSKKFEGPGLGLNPHSNFSRPESYCSAASIIIESVSIHFYNPKISKLK